MRERWTEKNGICNAEIFVKVAKELTGINFVALKQPKQWGETDEEFCCRLLTFFFSFR